jgi:RHS repeat-associated protein
VRFRYDALGRRVSKSYQGKVTRWLWDGNKLLHEWHELEVSASNVEQLITWLFEEDSFAPAGKLQGQKAYSIVCDHLGTPLQMHDQQGQLAWGVDLNSYGRVRKQEGETTTCPFRYQGQYEDQEIGLYYNRFRYYDPEAGQYVSQDPIGLMGGDKLYAYVNDPNGWIDVFGLNPLDINDFTKIGGGNNEADFITNHSFKKHKFDSTKISTKNKTQYGANMNVEKLRIDTLNSPDNVITKFDSAGNLYVTVYQKDYPFNISTPDTPTGKHRVFINQAVPDSSTQFPRVGPPKCS